MDNRPPIERVRDREQGARENMRDDREAMSQNSAKLQRKAANDAPIQQDDDQFEERVREKLKESGSDSSD